MKYLLAGILTGAIAGIFCFQGISASEILPEFYNSLSAVDDNAVTDNRKISDFFVVPKSGKVFLIDIKGNAVRTVDCQTNLLEFSGDGKYYIQYGKTGSKIELFGINGERYWQKDSREKPFMSYSGKLIFLLNGDHSSIRIFDTNGNITGPGQITGRLCTSIEFSEKDDFGACGFIDGSYYFVDRNGSVINKGESPSGNAVKGIRISSNGKFGFVHYGNTEKDGVRVVDISDNSYDDDDIGSVHVVKTAMHISNDGYAAFFDHDKVLVYDDDCDVQYKVNVPEKKTGFSTLAMQNGIYALGYTKSTGESQLVIFRNNGKIFYSKEYPDESFLSCSIRDNLIFLRGSDSLFAYSLHLQAE